MGVAFRALADLLPPRLPPHAAAAFREVDLTAYGFVDAPKKAAEEEVRPAF